MRCKAVMTNLLTVVGLIVEPITAIAKTNGSIEAYIYIRKTTITVIYSITVITPSLSRSLLSSVC